MNRTIIFDMHGIIFTYSKLNSLEESSSIWESKIKEYSKRYRRYKKAWSDCEHRNYKLALEVENISTHSGIEGDKSELQVYEMPGAIQKLLRHYNQGDKIVIASNSLVDTTKDILNFLFKSKKVKSEGKFIDTIDIYNMNLIGEKNEPKSWEKIFKKYKNIIDIYEDKKKNLEAAGIAARKLGFRVSLHSRI